MHVPRAFSLQGRGRVGDPAAGSVRLGGKHSPLPDYDSVTDEGVSPLRGIPRGRAKTRLELLSSTNLPALLLSLRPTGPNAFFYKSLLRYWHPNDVALSLGGAARLV